MGRAKHTFNASNIVWMADNEKNFANHFYMKNKNFKAFHSHNIHDNNDVANGCHARIELNRKKKRAIFFFPMNETAKRINFSIISYLIDDNRKTKEMGGKKNKMSCAGRPFVRRHCLLF